MFTAASFFQTYPCHCFFSLFLFFRYYKLLLFPGNLLYHALRNRFVVVKLHCELSRPCVLEAQVRRIAEHLGKRYHCWDNLSAAARFRSLRSFRGGNLHFPLRRQGILRNDHLDLHHRLQKNAAALRERFALDCHGTRDLERHFRGVNFVVEPSTSVTLKSTTS